MYISRTQVRLYDLSSGSDPYKFKDECLLDRVESYSGTVNQAGLFLEALGSL